MSSSSGNATIPHVVDVGNSHDIVEEMEQEVITEEMESNSMLIDGEEASVAEDASKEKNDYQYFRQNNTPDLKTYAIKKRETLSIDKKSSGENSSVKTSQKNNKMVFVKLLNKFESSGEASAATGSADKQDDDDKNDGVNDKEMNGEYPVVGKVKTKREIKQLHKMMKASKVLSDFMADENHVRMRKSRKSQNIRSLPRQQRGRSLSLINDSPNDFTMPKRSNMRSQNAEFSLKQQKFLSRIQQEQEDDAEEDLDEEMEEKDDDISDISETKSLKCTSEYGDAIPIVKISNLQKPPKDGSDYFCWRCHGASVNICCTQCVRSYHVKCAKPTANGQTADSWICPECVQPTDTSSSSNIPPDQLSTLLMFAWNRMTQLKKTTDAIENFNMQGVKKCESYIKNRISLADLKSNIRQKKYKFTNEFMTDVKWILHNCYVYYTCVRPYDTTLMKFVKSLVKVCKQEINEIETCSECYYNANTKTDWFVEVCTRPHILLWAKLKGFPYWPAKGMAVNGTTSVDVRFFGAHDRAWVPVKECFLYSEKNPSPVKTKRNNIERCIKEIDVHILKIKEKFGSFNYPEFRTQYDPLNELKQLQMMIPTYKGEKKVLPKALTGDVQTNSLSNSSPKNNLTYRIIKTADNNLSIAPVVKKSTETMNGAKDDQSKKQAEEEKNSKSNQPEVKATKIVISRKKYLDVMASNSETKTILESKSYQAVKKPSASSVSEERKVDSVIIKRRSSNWNAMPSTKKFRKSSDNEEGEGKTKDVAEQQVSSSDDLVKTAESNTTSNNSVSKKESQHVEATAGPSRVKIPPDSTKQKKSEEIETESMLKNKSKKKPTEEKPESDHDVNSTKPPTNDCSSSTSTTSKKPIVISTGNLFDNEEIRFEQSTSKTTPNEKSIIDTMIALPQISIIRNKSSSGNLVVDEKKSASKSDVTASESTNLPSTSRDAHQENRRRTRSSTFTSSNENNKKKEESAKIPDNSEETSSKTINESVIEVERNEIRIKSEPMSDNEEVSNITESHGGRMPGRSGRHQGKLQHRPFVSRASLPMSRKVASLRTRTAVDKIPRARKTFPTSLSSHLDSINNIQTMNSMVYIPIDSNIKRLEFESSNNSSPVPPLVTIDNTATAVSSSPVVASTSSSTTVGNSSLPIPPLVSTTNIQQPAVMQILPVDMTPGLAKVIAQDTIVRGGPPKLVPKPAGTFQSNGNAVFPSEAGPTCQLLVANSHKMTDFFRSVIEDTLGDLANNGCLDAKVKILEVEIEKLKNAHSKEILQLKKSTDLLISELKNSIEVEKTRVINETRKQCEMERIRVVEETKKKQWCVNCGKEAQFYCCWNTSYCDYPCQQQHWSRHMNTCAQNESNNEENNKTSQRKTSRSTSQSSSSSTSKGREGISKNVNPVSVRQNLRKTTSVTTSSPCYALVANRHGHGWEMVSGSQANISSSSNLSSSMVLNPQTSNAGCSTASTSTASPHVAGPSAIVEGHSLAPDTILTKK
ncbi:hypothetical protein DMENIID0001_164560 [Sergentomyia squamirostris]